MASTRAKFGYLSYEKMLNNLENETEPKRKLDPYDINFAPDTHECYVISPDLKPWPIRSRVYTFEDIETCVSQLNENTDTYAGQIVAIKENEKFCAYIVNPASGGWTVSPLSEKIGEIDYNSIGNRPIVNLYGEIGNPINISLQPDGVYIVNGQYIISGLINTIFSSSANEMFVVSKIEDSTRIKKITSKEITDYVLRVDRYETYSYLTSGYLEENGYINDNNLDEKLAALDVVTRSEMESYVNSIVGTSVEEAIGNNIDPIVEEKVSLAIDEKLQGASDSDIDGLF